MSGYFNWDLNGQDRLNAMQTIEQALDSVYLGRLDPGNMFYDWFCKEQSLSNRGKKLISRLKAILTSKKFNPKNTYVFFKNNCPCCGSLYDDFRICSKESGDVLYTIIPASGHDVNKGTAEVWGHDNDFKEPLVSGTWKDVKSFFLS